MKMIFSISVINIFLKWSTRYCISIIETFVTYLSTIHFLSQKEVNALLDGMVCVVQFIGFWREFILRHNIHVSHLLYLALLVSSK